MYVDQDMNINEDSTYRRRDLSSLDLKLYVRAFLSVSSLPLSPFQGMYISIIRAYLQDLQSANNKSL